MRSMIGGAAALVAVLVLSAASLPAEAQQRPKIGFLSANSLAAMAARTDAFRQGLRDLGYVEGENIVIEYQYADGKIDRLPALALELVRLKADVIVTEGTTATRYAKDTTATIPIVMAQDPDPVGTRFVASLARPGGNITGLSNFRPELGAKRLELLKEIVPRLARVAVIGTSTVPGTARSLKELELAATALTVELRYLDVPDSKATETVFRAASAGRADAVLVLASPVLLSNLAQIVSLAARSALPTIYYTAEFVLDGGLVSYGVNSHDLFRRAASYVDRILKGAKPAELPVEQPNKFDLVVNLKAARALRLTIAPPLLLRADRVIE